MIPPICETGRHRGPGFRVRRKRGQDSTPQRDPLLRNQHVDLLALVQLDEHLGLRLDLPVAAPVW